MTIFFGILAFLLFAIAMVIIISSISIATIIIVMGLFAVLVVLPTWLIIKLIRRKRKA